MSETVHPWCRNTARDEAIRAAEDAAAAERTPLPDHRDLPSVVHELRRRLEGLEAVADAWRRQCEAEAENRESAPDSRAGVNADGLRTERVTLEVTIRDGRQFGPQLDGVCGVVADYIGISRKRGESVRVVEEATIGSGDVFLDVGCGSTGDEIVRLTAERDAAIRERDAAKEECEDLRRKKDHNDRWLWEKVDGAEALALTAVEALRKISLLDYSHAAVNGAAYEAHCIAKAALQSAPAANAGGEANCPAAPDSSPQPPRGWLTDGERRAVEDGAFALVHSGYYGAQAKAELLRALLARSTPPRVKAPSKAFIILNGESMVDVRDNAWIAAIRDAGVEVSQ